VTRRIIDSPPPATWIVPEKVLFELVLEELLLPAQNRIKSLYTLPRGYKNKLAFSPQKYRMESELVRLAYEKDQLEIEANYSRVNKGQVAQPLRLRVSEGHFPNTIIVTGDTNKAIKFLEKESGRLHNGNFGPNTIRGTWILSSKSRSTIANFNNQQAYDEEVQRQAWIPTRH
jgi:hypothetical protein